MRYPKEKNLYNIESNPELRKQFSNFIYTYMYIFFNRSFVGANSGVITQRDVKMYEQREDTVTYVRVHSIPGMMNYINFEVRIFHRLNSIFLGKVYLRTTYVFGFYRPMYQ